MTDDELVRAFLTSLWPSGMHCPLENPTRTFFQARLGDIPSSSPIYGNSTADFAKYQMLADDLRSIAHSIDECVVVAMTNGKHKK